MQNLLYIESKEEKGGEGKWTETLVWDPYLLAWLDGGQGDTLSVDHRQDLVSDDRGNDLALGIG